MPLSYSIQLQTPYGAFLMNRNDWHQPVAIVQTGRPHIDREIQLILALADLLPDGSVAIDAGANIGLIAVPLAQRLAPRSGAVIAFEPQRLIYYMLAGNAAHAGLENLFCHQFALGSKGGTITVPQLDMHANQDFGQLSLAKPAQEGDAVQLLAIDELGLGRLDFIKIDVEFMELEVLEGARTSIDTFRPLIWIEIWPQQHGVVSEWLQKRNYSLSIVDDLNFLAVPNEREKEFPHDFVHYDGTNHPLCQPDASA